VVEPRPLAPFPFSWRGGGFSWITRIGEFGLQSLTPAADSG